eukprot:CAMPEP_0172534694 /NCGR_PEP_ID=MMETSP1067-20121228/6962_1 /TAXON_ID=265564 ORGANISM="Thalassiosira punctigera, Strain Tpunct2005C2" /NCGR_SAMPLE_ID=MMETSP1067 /ASSEMBLY_ACC=CAM_ASM_000444 /LENGTH=96 /DNA_ID=CAMNT_0013319511 /DNA_START=426 /DNA_END=712 /DNA_ORIENTATION=+
MAATMAGTMAASGLTGPSIPDNKFGRLDAVEIRLPTLRLARYDAGGFDIGAGALAGVGGEAPAVPPGQLMPLAMRDYRIRLWRRPMSIVDSSPSPA